MKTTNTTRLDYPANTATAGGIAHWEGRAFGAIVLAAFFLYGIGSANTDTPVGLVLVALNSAAVAAAGLIGFRLMRDVVPRVGLAYLAARIVEGVLLGVGIVLIRFADAQATGDAAYLLAMLALGIGSIPFCHALGRQNWLSQRMAMWGMAGYAALATGAFLELVTGQAVAITFAIPGGLFELALGIVLLRRGFGQSLKTANPWPEPRPEHSKPQADTPDLTFGLTPMWSINPNGIDHRTQQPFLRRHLRRDRPHHQQGTAPLDTGWEITATTRDYAQTGETVGTNQVLKTPPTDPAP